MRHIEERRSPDRKPRLDYDYERQCWIEGGKVVPCGHTERMSACYACNHAGERVERRKA